MDPLVKPIYAAYPKHVSPVDADKAILKSLARLKKEDGMSLLEAHAFLVGRTKAFADEWQTVLAKEPERKQFIPYPASWFNDDGFREEPGARTGVVPQKSRIPSIFDCEDRWDKIEEDYGITWEDKRYWKPSWNETWNALPAAVRAELTN